MPRTQPIVSFQRIREFAERFTWTDPVTSQPREGYNPPKGALHVNRKPFHIKFLTESGKLIEGDCITLRVNTSLHTRDVMFVNSREVRQVSDLFIIEIDGVRFQVH